MNCNNENWKNCAVYKHGVKREGGLFRCQFDPETEIALKNNYEGVWCRKESRPLAVFTAYHNQGGQCFTTLNAGDYKVSNYYCPRCGQLLAKANCRHANIDEISLGGADRDREVVVCRCDACGQTTGVIPIE